MLCTGSLYSFPEVESRTQDSRPRPRTQKNFEAKAKDRLTEPLKAKAKDQGHRRKCSQKKNSIFFSGDLKKKGLQKFFSGDKGLQNFFFRRSLREETKKRTSQIFRKVSGNFQRNFNGSKIVLSSSRGQGNFRGLEASKPRTSKFVLEDVRKAMDVLEDQTSVLFYNQKFNFPPKFIVATFFF